MNLPTPMLFFHLCSTLNAAALKPHQICHGHLLQGFSALYLDSTTPRHYRLLSASLPSLDVHNGGSSNLALPFFETKGHISSEVRSLRSDRHLSRYFKLLILSIFCPRRMDSVCRYFWYKTAQETTTNLIRALFSTPK